MRNLKKVLSLVLCVAVMLSVMVLGAGAAFSDQDQIENTEAVDATTALNIISGYEDGSFHPERNIKRSEMCKMICIALNGGKEPATSTKDDPTFTDIDGHWAEGYIEYCYAKGVVSGVGGGRFNPDGNVTVTQAAKMLLVALGYNADVELFNGENWSLYVNVKANQDGIYEGLEAIDTAAALTRDQAAQMIWNTMQAVIIVKTSSIDVTTGDVTETYSKDVGGITLLNDKYKTNINVGTLISVDGKNLGIQMSNVDKLDSNTANEDFTGVDVDYSALMGQKVKVMFTKANDVQGVFATADNTVYNTVMNNIEADGAKLKFDNASYSVDDSIATYIDGASAGNKNAAYFVNDSTANNVTLVDTDADNKIDTAVIQTVDVQKVTYVSSSSIIAGGKTYRFADENIAEGLAKDDWVIITNNLFDDCKDIVKADMLQTTINGYKDENAGGGVNAGDKYLIDGNWYEIAAGADLDNANVKVGVTAKVVVVNGMIFYTKKVSGEGASADLAFVVSAGTSIYGDQVKLMFLDGTTKVVTIDDNTTVTPTVGKFYEYTVSGEKYQFENINTGTEYGDYKYNNTLTTVQETSSKISDISGTGISDSAKVIVWVTDGSNKQDAKMITGKQLKTLRADTTDNNDDIDNGATAIAFTSDVDGLTRVSLAMVKYEGTTAGVFGSNMDNLATNANYGYITSDAYTINDGYIQFTMWTGSTNETVKFKSSSTTGYVKGAVVGYDSLTDGEVKGLQKITMTAGAITGVNSDGSKIVIDSKNDQLKLDSDVTVLYVNSGADTDKGEEIGLTSGSPEAAAKVVDVTSTTIYNTNILYNGDGINTTDVIVIDATGKFDNDVYANSVTLTGLTGIQVTDADGKILSNGDKVLKGDILTVENIGVGGTATVAATNAVLSNGSAATLNLAKGETGTVIVNHTTSAVVFTNTVYTVSANNMALTNGLQATVTASPSGTVASGTVVTVTVHVTGTADATSAAWTLTSTDADASSYAVVGTPTGVNVTAAGGAEITANSGESVDATFTFTVTVDSTKTITVAGA